MVVCCRIPSPQKKLHSALWELVCLSRPFAPARGEFSVPAQFSLQTSYHCARPVVGSSFAMLVSLTAIAARANGELKRSGWLFLEGRNDFRGDQVRSVWSVWITPSWRRFLCFVRRTTSIQTADLNFFKKFENDTDTFGSWVFLFISIPTCTQSMSNCKCNNNVAHLTCCHGNGKKRMETFQDSEIMEVEFGSVALRLQYSAKWEGRSGTELPMGIGLRGTHWKVWVNALVCRQCKQKLKQEYYTLLPFFDCARSNHLGTSNLNSIMACLPMLFHPTTIITKNL